MPVLTIASSAVTAAAASATPEVTAAAAPVITAAPAITAAAVTAAPEVTAVAVPAVGSIPTYPFAYALYAACVVSLASIIVCILTIWATNKRHESQLKSEKDSKTTEAKRETFLELIDATEGMTDRILHIPTLNEEQLEDKLKSYEESFVEFISASSKASITAHENTLIHLQNLQFAHQDFFAKLMKLIKNNMHWKSIIEPIKEEMATRQNAYAEMLEASQNNKVKYKPSDLAKAKDRLRESTIKFQKPYELITESFVNMIDAYKETSPVLIELKFNLSESLRSELKIKNDSALQERLLKAEIDREVLILDQMKDGMESRLKRDQLLAEHFLKMTAK